MAALAKSLDCLTRNFYLRRQGCLFLKKNYSTASTKYVVTNLDANTGVAEVKLNRPPVNSMNLELLQEISATLKQLENTKGCRGLIFTSSSPTVFCAGLDIMEMYQPKPERIREFWSSLQQMWMDLYGSKLITMAAINGHSPAGGCLLALSCDYRVMMGGKFTIGMNETLLGIVAPKWFQGTMLNTIGNRQGELSLQLGKMYTAEEALKINMIDQVATSADDLKNKVTTEMQKWLKIPAFARQTTKRNLRQHFIDDLSATREDDINTFLKFVSLEKTQKSLGMYLEALKKKKG